METRLTVERRVIIIDDEYLIAMELDVLLSRFGYSVVQLLSSEDEAITWIRHNPADVAILDIGLQNRMCTDLATALKAADIPFIVHSGYRSDDVDETFRSGVWISKPADVAALQYALETIERRRRSSQ